MRHTTYATTSTTAGVYSLHELAQQSYRLPNAQDLRFAAGVLVTVTGASLVLADLARTFSTLV